MYFVKYGFSHLGKVQILSLIGSYNNDSLDAQLLSNEKEAVQLMEINGKE